MQNWTQNQRLVVNALISIFLTALVAALQAIIQKSSSGIVDIPSLINVGIVVFGASFSPAMISYIPSHAQQELQALRDLTTELTAHKDVPPTATPVSSNVPTK